MKIRIDEPRWIWRAGFRIGFVAVEDVSAKRRHGDSIYGLRGTRPWFGELASHACDTDDLFLRSVDQD